mmetsp:Transcript_119344/g.380597  ORF Transcript_119344/g.380597 Transcript_119344/m.380597 type:complete len:82 (+) Transcript_119344:759-1004(+)
MQSGRGAKRAAASRSFVVAWRSYPLGVAPDGTCLGGWLDRTLAMICSLVEGMFFACLPMMFSRTLLFVLPALASRSLASVW